MKTARSILLELALTLWIKKRAAQGYDRRAVEGCLFGAVRRRCNKYFKEPKSDG